VSAPAFITVKLTTIVGDTLRLYQKGANGEYVGTLVAGDTLLLLSTAETIETGKTVNLYAGTWAKTYKLKGDPGIPYLVMGKGGGDLPKLATCTILSGEPPPPPPPPPAAMSLPCGIGLPMRPETTSSVAWDGEPPSEITPADTIYIIADPAWMVLHGLRIVAPPNTSIYRQAPGSPGDFQHGVVFTNPFFIKP